MEFLMTFIGVGMDFVVGLYNSRIRGMVKN